MLAGDRNALEFLYRQYVQLLYDYGLKISKDPALTEDAIQNLFIDIWEKRDKLNQTTNVRAYLLLSMRRRLIRSLSKQQKNTPFDNQEQHFFLEADPESDWISRESTDERMIRLQTALQQLNAQQKEILFLKYHRGLKSQEIAEILEIRDQSVRNALYRTLQKLKELMISWVFLSTINGVGYSIIKGLM
jgi:RNA polymerase sigma factor (sigma-70 family)